MEVRKPLKVIRISIMSAQFSIPITRVVILLFRVNLAFEAD